MDRDVARGPRAVAEVLSVISEEARRVLVAYAERMASLAVRRHDRSTLVKGLVALMLGGLDENRRESLMLLAPLEDSAARIGVDLTELFQEVSVVVGTPLDQNLMAWLMRDAEDRSLASMGFDVGQDDSGFRYKLNW